LTSRITATREARSAGRRCPLAAGRNPVTSARLYRWWAHFWDPLALLYPFRTSAKPKAAPTAGNWERPGGLSVPVLHGGRKAFAVLRLGSCVPFNP
jgi:hypothetical protein